MTFSLLTYNLLLNRAYSKLNDIIKKHNPDIICLQEIDTNGNNLSRLVLENNEYRLADYSNSFIKYGQIYGVATFYNTNKFTYTDSEVITLPRSLYELISKIFKRANNPRTVLQTALSQKKSKKTVIIYNAHLTAFGTNQVKINQIEETLGDLYKNNNGSAIIAGDFNYYPWARKKLENLMSRYNFREATFEIPYTFRYSLKGKFGKLNLIQQLSAKLHNRLFSTNRMKLDYIFYKNLVLLGSKKVEIKTSDHYPIISTFRV